MSFATGHNFLKLMSVKMYFNLEHHSVKLCGFFVGLCEKLFHKVTRRNSKLHKGKISIKMYNKFQHYSL